MFPLEELENVYATTVHHEWKTDINKIGIIGMGLGLVLNDYLAKTRGEWKFTRGWKGFSTSKVPGNCFFR